MKLKELAREAPEMLGEILDKADFNGTEIFHIYSTISDDSKIPHSEKPVELWLQIGNLVEAAQDVLDEEAARNNECPYCHGSGGGYMGGSEPRCTFCNGTGERQ